MSRHLARIGGMARPAGSAAAAEARRYCAEQLGAAGFATREIEFGYSRFPGSWATPAAGVLIPLFASALYAVRERGSAAIIGVASLMAVTAAALWYLGGRGVLDAPAMRARGINLEATRGDAAVWLVAHIDSKWQPVPMLARILGVIITAVALVGLAVAVLARPDAAVVWLAIVWIGAVPLMLSVVGARNHGTLDNASGVATVLAAVELLPADHPLGVLITDAEELALAGAAAWARGRPPGIALNVDSVDDAGALVAMYSGSTPDRLISRLRAAASDAGEPLRVLRLIPGILTDSVALAAAGWTTLTLSRGTIRTLKRIHTSRDTLAHMDGRGIAGAARVLARTVSELI